MRATSTAPLFLAFAALASATCYKKGESSTQQDRDALNANDKEALRLICNDLTSGGFVKDQESRQCHVAKSGNTHLDFIIKRHSGGEHEIFLSSSDCVEGLQRELNSCEHGGNRKYDDFEVTYVFNPMAR